MKTFLLSITFFVLSITVVFSTENIIFVASDATGSGESWADAANFSAAANTARNSVVKPQIWVKEGTYLFTAPENFDYLLIYGGFKGDETSLEQRDWSTNQTIFDGGTTSSILRNTISPDRVGGNGVSITCLLDGVIIQNGHVFGGNKNRIPGGGMQINKGARISNCIFRNNKSDYGHGGALFCQGDTDGKNDFLIENSLFINNQAQLNGGGVQIGGFAKAIFVNCTFANNKAIEQSGGGVGGGSSTTSDLIFVNTIAYNNYAGDVKSSYGIASDVNAGGTVVSLHSAIESASTRFLDVDDEGHIVLNESISPMFILPSSNIGYTTDATKLAEIFAASYKLEKTSPCLNTGTTTDLPTGITIPAKDLAGKARIENNAIDMGAYEYENSTSTSFVNGAHLYAYTNESNIYVFGAIKGDLLKVIDTHGRILKQQVVKTDCTKISVNTKGIYIITSGKNIIKVSL